MRQLSRRSVWFLLAALCTAGATLVALSLFGGHSLRGPGRHPVGFSERTFPTRLGEREGVVFYPARPGSAERELRYNRIHRGRAGRDASPAEGRFPLVLLSHGFSARPDELAWLGERLAADGMIAIGVAHSDGDRIDPAALVRRAQDLRAVVDFALADSSLSARLDPQRIAVAGHSLGGATALVLAGVLPAGHGSQREVRLSAALATAPGPHSALDDQSFANVTIPVVLVTGEVDEVTPASQNAIAFQGRLPHSKLIRIPAAGHYLFKPPCTAWGRLRAPQVCRDARGINRREWHDQIAEELIRLLGGR